MTVANLRIFLERAIKDENTEDIEMLKARIERKLKHPKYANLVEEKPKVTKSKEKK